MNLMLNGFKGATFLWGDSLSNPKLLDHGGLRKFDIVVSVPPFADKWAAEEAYSDFTNALNMAFLLKVRLHGRI